LLAACGGGNAMSGYSHYGQELDPRKHPYVIGTGDRLSVVVWQEPDLSRDVQVRPDGTVTLPLVGEVHAAGKTPTQLKEELKQRMQNYVKQPIVTVSVEAVASYRFTVSGNVAQNGIFAPGYYVTVAEAIAMAGGPTEYADGDDVVLIRTDPGGQLRRIPIDYEAILDGDNPEQNIVVLPGDNLFVP